MSQPDHFSLVQEGLGVLGTPLHPVQVATSPVYAPSTLTLLLIIHIINFKPSLSHIIYFLFDSAVKIPPAMQETLVQSLGGEDSLGEGYGNPPQYSCLDKSMDRGS